MTKTISLLFLVFLSLAFMLGGVSAFAGGDGSVGNPYQISNWTDLNSIRNNLTSSYILINSLSSSTSDYVGIGNIWQPIGDCGGNNCNSNPDNPFLGNLKGNSKTISNISINQPSTYGVGFFGYNFGNITNLKIEINSISGSNYVGGLVGYNNQGRIINCSTTIYNNISSSAFVGGLVGYEDAGFITNSFVNLYGNIFSSSHVSYGSFIGIESFGIVNNSNSVVISSLYNSGMENLNFIGDNYGTVTNSTQLITYGNTPIFSNQTDNNGTLINSGTGQFNVSVNQTNGTVILNIDNTNITATTSDNVVYLASHTFSSAGNYPYYWSSYGSGVYANYNQSDVGTYTIILSNSNSPTNLNQACIAITNGLSQVPGIFLLLIIITIFSVMTLNYVSSIERSSNSYGYITVNESKLNMKSLPAIILGIIIAGLIAIVGIFIITSIGGC